jgi:DNA invertase Pin-like site-specific DNA recombinase
MGTSHKGGMLVGYARVSTGDQNLDLQEGALRKAGCVKLFTDVASGAKDERAGLAEALAFLRPGDTLVVWKLDRLGRSLKHLIETVTALQRGRSGSAASRSRSTRRPAAGSSSFTSSGPWPSSSGI